MEKIYKSFDHYLIRTPLFSLNQTWSDIVNSPYFPVSLKIASKDLFEATNKKSAFEDLPSKVKRSVYKYAQRSKSRSTPFGIFAGCSIGEFSDKETSIELCHQDNYVIFCRLDFRFLTQLVDHLEKIPSVKAQLKYYPNKTIYKSCGKLKFYEYNTQNYTLSKVDISEYLDIVLEKSEIGIQYNDIVKLLTSDEITQNEAVEFVDQIIYSKILCSELHLSSTGEEPLDLIASKLSLMIDVDEIQSKISELHDYLKRLNKQKLSGLTIQSISDIESMAQALVPFKISYNIIQVDLIKPLNSTFLSKQYESDLADIIPILLNVETKNSSPNKHLTSFVESFKKRYGDQEIPLLKALDPEVGIGYKNRIYNTITEELIQDIPYLNNVEHEKQDDDKSGLSGWEMMLLKKYTETIARGDNEIILDEKDLIPYQTDAPNFPNTVGVLCKILYEEQAKGTILLDSISNYPARLMARFCHASSAINDLCKSICEKEEKNNGITAEINHIPQPLAGNIIHHPALLKYEIVFFQSNNEKAPIIIPISDLYICIQNNKIKIKSCKLNVNLLPVLSSAYVYNMKTLPIFQFLFDAYFQDVVSGYCFEWSKLIRSLSNCYLPRIRYKNIIISPLQWKIDFKEIPSWDQDILLEYFENKMIPTNFFLVEGGEELYVDIRDPLGLNVLEIAARNRGVVWIKESFFGKSNNIVTDQGQAAFYNEFIIPFYR